MVHKKWSPETLGIHAGYKFDPVTGAKTVPIYETTSFVFKDTGEAADLFALKKSGNIYTRLMNPTNDVLEKRVAVLEGGSAAVAVSSGQAAITLSILNLASSGDEVVASSSLYGGTYTLFHYTLRKLGINVVFVNPENPDNFKNAITKKTKAVYAETLGNPKLDTIDFEKIAKIAHEKGVPFIVDNTVGTPFLVNPIRFGADIVVHSATKYIGGYGAAIGGIVVDSGKFDWANGKFPQFIKPDASYHGIKFVEKFGNVPKIGNMTFAARLRLSFLRDMGSCMSPFNAFLFLLGLQTLHLRMPCHSENALKVAEFLKTHKKVLSVNYPGLKEHPQYRLASKYFKNGWYSGLLGFEIRGAMTAGKKFINSLKLISHLANIGDASSLAIHPASTTHGQLSAKELRAVGVSESFVRLSIGIENVDDIIKDIEQALG
ncbi:MAG: O-acetylhomoserine aminocarboxypropyltransferase/cysteine synthase family protein [Candidatus Omnitrophota bacterium]|nr:O-acetylhomoserine aminocarboxypropyltransferase/cysteine synthase [Candidatus Omnitrophota bacterium]MBU1895236.1 O-acetylhomoserine aminocarboxypropyltransferase/cysteine synthase [Candidatus Omnitrophota bacterium]